jgi:hypothetical protein
VREGSGCVKESGSQVEVKTEGILYEYQYKEEDMKACLRGEIKRGGSITQPKRTDRKANLPERVVSFFFGKTK